MRFTGSLSQATNVLQEMILQEDSQKSTELMRSALREVLEEIN